MAGRTLLYGSDAAGVNPVLIQNQRVPCSSSDPHDSIFMPASSPSFLGSRSMVSFDQDVNNGRKRMEKTFYGSFDQECDNGGVGDEDYEDYLRQPEKKRRLTVEQVQFLERSFELENKLEPERKIELAKELGLQPRQIAIWFQNRRARWKTKQLEKDYDVLQTNYDKLKSDYDNLLMEKNKLKAEVAEMTEKLLLKGKEEGEITKDPSSADDSVSEDNDHHHQESKGSELDGLKHEDLSSAKSDVLDSDSPRCYIDGGGDYSSFLQENGDSSYVFEPEQSDLSQDDDEDDNISKNPVLHPAAAAAAVGGYFFPKMEEDGCCYTDPPSSSYFGGFPVEDQTFGFWQYN